MTCITHINRREFYPLRETKCELIHQYLNLVYASESIKMYSKYKQVQHGIYGRRKQQKLSTDWIEIRQSQPASMT